MLPSRRPPRPLTIRPRFAGFAIWPLLGPLSFALGFLALTILPLAFVAILATGMILRLPLTAKAFFVLMVQRGSIARSGANLQFVQLIPLFIRAVPIRDGK